MKKVIVFFFCLALSLPVFAQSKAETKLYNKTLSAPTLKSYDKFLKKYPQGVYAADILARKDTLLNISPYSMEDAGSIAAPFFGAGAAVKAFAYRSEAIDRINVVAVKADTLNVGDVRVAVLVKDAKKGWGVESSYDRYAFEDKDFTSVELVDSSYVLKVGKKQFLFFNCLMTGADVQDYLAAAYCFDTEEFSTVLFSGKSVLGAGESGYGILGRPDASARVQNPEVNLLVKFIEDNPRLQKVSDADYYTDAAIEFWLQKNPDALTSATRVTASVIDPSSSLIDQYKKAKGKQNSSKYTAALVDFRGYTMIIVYQKATQDYILAWVEPECRNHNTDRLLNSIEFQDSNSLEMFYYQGKKYFKYHLNLASKTLRRN